jgi:hypothetical protein
MRVRYDDSELASSLRFVDEEDDYVLAVGFGRNGHCEVALTRVVDGNRTRVETQSFSRNLWNDESVFDIRGSWLPVRVVWQTVDRAFRVRVFEDANEDGEWTELGGEVLDSDAKFGPGQGENGGGVGFGGSTPWDGADSLWYDETDSYDGTGE